MQEKIYEQHNKVGDTEKKISSGELFREFCSELKGKRKTHEQFNKFWWSQEPCLCDSNKLINCT